MKKAIAKGLINKSATSAPKPKIYETPPLFMMGGRKMYSKRNSKHIPELVARDKRLVAGFLGNEDMVLRDADYVSIRDALLRKFNHEMSPTWKDTFQHGSINIHRDLLRGFHTKPPK